MFKIQAPTLKGEIKKARASNYTWQRVISEFIDNSNDVLIKSEQSQKVIQIKLNLDTNDNLVCPTDLKDIDCTKLTNIKELYTTGSIIITINKKGTPKITP